MNIHFKDRFNRKYYLHREYEIRYCENQQFGLCNRANLPSNIIIDGTIGWLSRSSILHSIVGPALMSINGVMLYALNGKEVSKMEIMLND